MTIIAVVAGMLLAACNGGGGGSGGGGGADTGSGDSTTAGGDGGETSAAESGGESGPAAVLAAASTKTAEAGSSRMAFDVKIGEPNSEELTPFFTGKAKFDPENNRGVMTMTIEGLEGLAGLAGGGTGGGNAGAGGGNGGGGGGGGGAPTQKTLILGDMLYQESAIPLPGGKRWLRIDASQPAGASESAAASGLGGSPATGQSTSLTSSALWLEGATETSEVGTDQIRDGESATKYETVIDVEKVATTSDEAASSMAPFNQLGVTRFPATVWIDDEGRMRQLAYTLTVDSENAGMPAGTRLDYLIEVWDFGVKVNVKEPPAGKVADFDEVLGDMEQSLQDLQGDLDQLGTELEGTGGG